MVSWMRAPNSPVAGWASMPLRWRVRTRVALWLFNLSDWFGYWGAVLMERSARERDRL